MTQQSQTVASQGLRPFGVFAILYVAAFVCELSDDWRQPVSAALTVAITSALVALPITRARFCAFLVASSAFLLLFRYPEVGNHIRIVRIRVLILHLGGVRLRS